MSTQPTRRRLEAGIYERVDAEGARLGLEIAFKDTAGKARRRTVHGNLDDARDQLAAARVRRAGREREPDDPRVSFNGVCDAFEAAHVATLRPNSRAVNRSALRRLRKTFGKKRITAIGKADLKTFIADERREGLKGWTIHSHLAVLSAIYSFARDDLDMPVTVPRLKPAERPRPADDAREHRVLNDEELATVLAAVGDRERLYFRTLAEAGARASEVLGLTRRRVDVSAAELAFAEQLGRPRRITGGGHEGDGLRPLKTHVSRRTIEITRSLAAELALAGGRDRIFDLTHDHVDYAWRKALKRAALADPQPTIHDLRHTHVSGLIADGWDPVEIAQRIGDTLATTLRVYAHEFDARRRGEQRHRALEARYGTADGNPNPADGNPSSIALRDGEGAEVADLQAIRDKRQ
jgi:integrase